MKTNILFNILLLPAFLILFTACNESKFLDLTDPNNSTEEDYWKTEADVEAAMATVYSPIRAQMYGYYGAETGWQVQNGRSDDTWNRQDSQSMWQLTTFINSSGTGTNGDIFSSLYQCIHRANTLLQNIEEVPLTDTRMNELKAEALFLRGFSFFLLVINWGDVPLRLETADTAEEAMLASSPEAEIWKRIEADLAFAKQHLPVNRPDSELGRVTKGAAIAYLGKSYVYQGKYEDAEKELGLLLDAPYSYDLMPEYEDNFTEFNEFNKESIFEINYSDYGTDGFWGSEESTSMQGIALPKYIGTGATGGWFKAMPSPSIINEYITELRPAGSDTKYDKRMYTNFFFEYSDFNDVKANEVFYGGTKPFDDLWTSAGGSLAGVEPDYPVIEGVKGRFLTKKYTNFWIADDNADHVEVLGHRSNNYRIMRFAEVLLLHAEACLQNNNLTQAAAHLNRIRERAGLPYKTWAGKEELWEELKHQKLLEFYQEGVRFFDLKRWYTASELKQHFIQKKKQGAESFEHKHFYLPIPDGEMNTNKAIEQHPLWR
ncbi:MAG: RagB/SusD family nutrient uptake outer membrane protein [Tannerellaceae bacterium]|nr:RagB/SusD family nutrient uptake outer membrane protein [Tannerellaceae bacterium]